MSLDLEKLIGIAILTLVAFWFYDYYQPEIQEKIGDVRQAQLDRFVKAEGYFHTFKYDEAIVCYRQALAKGLSEPRQQEAYFRVPAALDKAGRKQEALDAYREAIKRYPNSEDATRAQAAIEKLRVETGQ